MNNLSIYHIKAVNVLYVKSVFGKLLQAVFLSKNGIEILKKYSFLKLSIIINNIYIRSGYFAVFK